MAIIKLQLEGEATYSLFEERRSNVDLMVSW